MGPFTLGGGLLPWGLVSELGHETEGPRARELTGAILIADISGYTRITERLCGLGDEGLGRLSELLNREFSRYLDVVAAHDGEIISFAGDALIARPAGCGRTGSPNPAASACRRTRRWCAPRAR